VSSESTEEVERIVIEDSVEGESYMVRTVGTERWVEEREEPVPRQKRAGEKEKGIRNCGR